MESIIDDGLLAQFIHSFYGYGNYKSSYWFVGMEEGGGNTIAEINKRISVWAARGERELEDVAEYHRAIGIPELFNNKPKLQPTWNKLIRIYLSNNGEAPITEQVREYQRDYLGRLDGDTCLIELLPLPSPSTGEWLYDKCSNLPYLLDRVTYKQAVVGSRISHIQGSINQHNPKVVVFYGLRYWEHWQEIAQVEFGMNDDGVYFSRNEASLFVIVKHPATVGVTNDYFHKAGEEISLRLQ